MSNCSLTPQAHKEYIKLVNNYKLGLKMRNLTLNVLSVDENNFYLSNYNEQYC